MLSPPLLAQLLDHAHDGLLAFDTEFRYTLWNAEMERITGVPRDQVLGHIAFELFPFLKQTGHDRAFHDALAGRTTISRDRPFAIASAHGRTGQVFSKQGFARGQPPIPLTFDSTHAPLYDATGRIVGGFAVVRDITEIKQKTAQAVRAEQCFQKLVEQSPLSIQTYAPDGRPLSGNPAWERLFGVTHADIAAHFNLLTDPQMNASGIMPHIRRAFAGETVTTPPIRFVPDRGIYKDQERWAGAIFYPVKDEQGNVEQVVLIHNDVTETKRHEDKLKLHATVLEHMTEGVSLSDENGIIVWTNPAEDQMFGYAPGELVGQHVSCQNTYPPDENQRIVNEIIDHLKRHGSWTGEFSNRRKDGSAFTTVANITTMQINGRTHRLCVQRDITPRKRAEEALRQSQTRLQALFDTTQDAILLADDHGRFVDANPAACEMTGHSRQELLQHQLFDLTPLPAHADAQAQWSALVSAGRQAGEFTVRRKDGTLVPAEYRAVANILPGLHLSVLRDVTKRRRAEEALRESEARFRTMADSAPVLVWIADADKRCTWFNRGWLQFTGRTMEQEFGFGWVEGLHADDADRCVNTYVSGFDAQQPFVLEYRLRRHDGAYRWVLDTGVPRFGPDGVFAGYIGSCIDIHERKQIEQELRAAKDAAEKASSAKDEFLAVLSHELRTPLTPVLLTVSLLQANQQLPLDVRNDLATVRQNIELEARLIDDLLDLTRIARGLLHLNPAPLDVHLLLRRTIALCFPDDAMPVITDLAATRHHVFADPARLQQVFWNLLNNARKYTPPAGRITIRTADAHDGRISVEVADTGIGIAPELLPNIFDAFVQGELGGKKRAGLGLGLAIAKAIVTAHAGEIAARSEGPGRGATFAVTLATIPAPAEAPKLAAPAPDSAANGASLSILLVEDNEPTLTVLQRLLTAMGHRVTPASTVEVALKRAADADDRYDLVISDIGLPDGTGYDLMRALRQRRDIPGIALSGYGMEEDVQKSLAAGFAEHLTKPIDVQTLERSLARLTE